MIKILSGKLTSEGVVGSLLGVGVREFGDEVRLGFALPQPVQGK